MCLSGILVPCLSGGLALDGPAQAKKMAKRSSLTKTKVEENGIPSGIFKCGEVIDLTEDD
jgi:hypothetical protein